MLDQPHQSNEVSVLSCARENPGEPVLYCWTVVAIRNAGSWNELSQPCRGIQCSKYLQKHASEREDVTLGAARPVEVTLWRSIAGVELIHISCDQVGSRTVIACDAEVSKNDSEPAILVGPQQDIGRFDILVSYPVLMSKRQCDCQTAKTSPQSIVLGLLTGWSSCCGASP